jgi:hypothetical protein
LALPTPEPGLVICYSYLWHSEHEQGRDEGAKDRPCVIIIRVQEDDGHQLVTVVPITHSAPKSSTQAVKIPPATKHRLGLDDDRSWVIIDEVNEFRRPGPDVRAVSPERAAYGVLPPRLFCRIRDQLVALGTKGNLNSVPRTE